jgi:hypothetical protein
MPKIRIIYKKLGKEKAHGIACSDGEILIDSRLRGKKALEILIHEVLHILNAEDSEDEIVRKSVALTKILWKEGYRRVDNHDKDLLQDGSK